MSNPLKRPAYPGDRLLKIPESAKTANSGVSTIYKWMGEGRIPSVKVGGSRRIWESALYEVLQEDQEDYRRLPSRCGAGRDFR